jgi:VIT1/CCC1 family predicted Fe2+/Mn2+ transporter
LDDLEAAMLTNLEDTVHFQSMRLKALLAAVVVFFTPLTSCTVAVSPFILNILGLMPLKIAVWASIAMALITIFTVGAYMSRDSNGNPLSRGARMVLFGSGAFLLSIWLESMIG